MSMDQSTSLIKLSLLGLWQLVDTANPRAKEPRRKEQGRLAYLAVEANQPHSRDSLIGLFWPELSYPNREDDPEAARYAAVRLFADRAHRLNKTFVLSQDTVEPVVRICRLVEGLPLGLEMAATWVRGFSG